VKMRLTKDFDMRNLPMAQIPEGSCWIIQPVINHKLMNLMSSMIISIVLRK